MTSKKMTSKQKRMKQAVEYLQHYMITYSNQMGYLDYAEETLIDDVLYGLGVALAPKKHTFADGFKKFKLRLLKHLEEGFRSRSESYHLYYRLRWMGAEVGKADEPRYTILRSDTEKVVAYCKTKEEAEAMCSRQKG